MHRLKVCGKDFTILNKRFKTVVFEKFIESRNAKIRKLTIMFSIYNKKLKFRERQWNDGYFQYAGYRMHKHYSIKIKLDEIHIECLWYQYGQVRSY